ncbi:TonB-dependent receptor [Sphingobium sp. JS3065]|uniref:TonB-dependent receptor plug domain-containing protein n=1 Tax=Sphingobium sp. JS3065 TaxID=2970925 RepID=UPI002264DFE8|nr:TonB-dependent receptor [Sphingobium sp. JS3065]UZW57748.1 TonB-dependent receptor [Sphingobium sp. JS3065]
MKHDRLYLCSTALAGALLTPAPLFAQSVSAPDGAEADASAIIVTGVRGAPRTVAESPAPIDVVGAEKLQATGSAEFGEALSKLLPSLNFGATNAGVFSVGRPVTNRGLAPAYTLVLVNGKRRHNGAFLNNSIADTSGANPVDVDLIPTSAIDRIEVLKDSAAAQYGTDAIAGVINIQLAEKEGLSGDFTYGTLYNANGRPDSWKGTIRYGTKIGDGGFLTLSGDIRKRGDAWWNLPAADTNIYGLPANRTVDQVAAASGLTRDQVLTNVADANARNAQWNRDGAHNGDPQIKAFNLSYNAELPVTENVTLYSFGTYGKRDAQIGNNFRRPNSTANFTALFPDGYYPLNNIDENDFQFVGGLRGTLGGWDYDVSSSFGRNYSHQYSKLSIRPSLGASSPTSWPNLANFEFRQWTHNVDLHREVEIGLARPLQISVGGEYRLDRFRTFAGDSLAYQPAAYRFQPGDQQYDWNVGLTASPVVQGAIVLSPADEADISRKVYAGYVDLGIYPLDAWYIGAAIRAEHYSDGSGSPVGLKLNSRYEVSPAFAIRGTVGTGFRAPSLTQIGYEQTDGRTSSFFNAETGQTELRPTVAKLVTADSTVGQLLGARPLKAEKTWNAGLGFVFTPAPSLSVTLDGYYIRIKNRIERTGRLFGPGISAILAANGLSDIEQAEYFINAADTTTRGFDLVADYSKSLGDLGKLGLTLAFNYSKTEVTDLVATPSQLFGPTGASLLGAGSVFFGGDKIGELEVLQPRTKLVSTLNWSKGIFGLSLTATRYGKYTQRTAAGDDRHFGAKIITDASVSAKVTEFATLSVGATNLFDVRPEKNGPGNPQTGQGYYGSSPFNPAGGYYYGRIALAF